MVKITKITIAVLVAVILFLLILWSQRNTENPCEPIYSQPQTEELEDGMFMMTESDLQQITRDGRYEGYRNALEDLSKSIRNSNRTTEQIIDSLNQANEQN